jgi:hypothetical protein
MPDSFGVSKDSIHIPYRRFLSDSAAGFLAILVAACAYYLPLLGAQALRDVTGPVPPIGKEAKFFVMLILFILATPIGFAVNATSWFVLGHLVARIERWCARAAGADTILFPVWDVAMSRCEQFVRMDLDPNGMKFEHLASLARHAIEVPLLSRLCPETQTRGLVIFFRNASFFALLIGLANLTSVRAAKLSAVLMLTLVALVPVLTIRWGAFAKRSRALTITAILAIFVVGIVAVAFGVMRWSVASMSWLSASVALVFLAGVVGYYNGCDVLLHLYLAAAALGGSSSRLAVVEEQQALLGIVKMIRRAAEPTKSP